MVLTVGIFLLKSIIHDTKNIFVQLSPFMVVVFFIVAMFFLVKWSMAPDIQTNVYDMWRFSVDFSKSVGYGLLVSGLVLLVTDLTDPLKTGMAYGMITFSVLLLIYGIRAETKFNHMKESVNSIGLKKRKNK